MICLRARLYILFIILGIVGIAQGAELTLSPVDRILILAPHPDDEVLCCGGMIQRAVQDHVPVKIVFLTYGDNNAWAFSVYHRFPVFRPKTMLAMGERRRLEALAAANILGMPLDQMIFLGYPDYGTLTIWNNHWGQSPPYESRMTRVRAVPYSTAYRPGAAYKGEEILRDLESIITDFRPTKIFAPHPAHLRPDHQALYFFARAALKNLVTAIAPKVYTYLVHYSAWPPHGGLHKDLALAPPPPFNSQTQWLMLPLTTAEEDKKYAALREHQTQWAYSRRSMTSYVRRNELFYDSTLCLEGSAITGDDCRGR